MSHEIMRRRPLPGDVRSTIVPVDVPVTVDFCPDTMIRVVDKIEDSHACGALVQERGHACGAVRT